MVRWWVYFKEDLLMGTGKDSPGRMESALAEKEDTSFGKSDLG